MGKIKKVFGELTFNTKVMRERLSKEGYEKMLNVIENQGAMDEAIASEVAHAMKDWAIDNGATHFTHWFQPQRGGTAEKHDSFISYDEFGNVIERFSASQLIQSEPDASSFPSGGMRTTFEARGYTAWDPTSNAFLLESKGTKTLVIPSVFLSWTGDVLDTKTPFLRSIKVVSDSAIKLQKLLGNRFARTIKVYAGPEQEYFLFSKKLIKSRPDLEVCGRTLFGTTPAKGQQMEDHYFGAIKERVLRFMEDLDIECYRRGIPVKTRHNEVAPNQFEIAPLYQEANLAIDNNLQIMNIIPKIADRHGLFATLHEKPLQGVNGSGKHFNWSIGDNTGSNYLEPSKSPLKNISFLMTIGAILLGIKKHGEILRTSVADAGNDHRLGANEAPPAIMSVYLGEYLEGLLNEIEGIGKLTKEKFTHISLGVQNLPKVSKDYSDRNRTSPIAFTGNKFEFRAVGSSHNCSEAATTFNLIVAYGYNEITKRLEKQTSKDIKIAALETLKQVIQETKNVRFEGDNYTDSWHKEAEKRGLPNAKNTPAALELLLKKDSLDLFSKCNVLSERELKSKIHIKLETYIKTKDIEYKTAINMTHTLIIPAVLNYINELGKACDITKTMQIEATALKNDLKKLVTLYSKIKTRITDLEKSLISFEEQEDIIKQAHMYADTGAQKLAGLREIVDETETLMPKKLWPIASYQELLLPL